MPVFHHIFLAHLPIISTNLSSYLTHLSVYHWTHLPALIAPQRWLLAFRTVATARLVHLLTPEIHLLQWFTNCSTKQLTQWFASTSLRLCLKVSSKSRICHFIGGGGAVQMSWYHFMKLSFNPSIYGLWT